MSVRSRPFNPNRTMRALVAASPLLHRAFLHAVVITALCAACFLLGIHVSGKSLFTQLPSFSAVATTSVSSSPDADLAANISSLKFHPSPPPPPAPVAPPRNPNSPFRNGVVDDFGVMCDDFEADPVEDDGLDEISTEDDVQPKERIRTPLKSFPACDEGKTEYVPCLDNEEAVRLLPSTERGENLERRCPEKGLDCLVPKPQGYKKPISWPESRDEVRFSNVPHMRLAEDKGGENWITRDGDKFRFPGGGTGFINGADKYINLISQIAPEISFGNKTRVVLDVGCGVASFGAYLLSRDVITMSIAPKDAHDNQIQFALERGVPAMLASFATRRLVYPSQAFDLIHCSHCNINWTRDDGTMLLEANRVLRAGGFFVWAAQPVYKHEEAQQEAWKDMENLTARLCWQLVNRDANIGIWRKPLSNTCYLNRGTDAQPPLCINDDPDNVWYANMSTCITQIPENGDGTNLTAWPARLHEVPARLESIKMDAVMVKKEIFRAENKYSIDIFEPVVRVFHWDRMNMRNIMDMNAGFGGFATAVFNFKMDSWVMNVVPTSGPNTLPVIYDRGLIGVLHDWCEPFDTYPRTYDMLYAVHLFSKEEKRCNITNILLEMDRILRPGGRACVLDYKETIEDIKVITDAMGWRSHIQGSIEGGHSNQKTLLCEKPMQL